MSTKLCPDCGGAGFWWAEGHHPGAISQGNPPRYKVACETCGGHEDGPGTGWVTEAPDGEIVAAYWHFCDLCGEPAFPDGLTSYEGPHGEATVVALCPRCAQTHRIEIVAKAGQGALDQERP